jgi:hypothetical protein
LGRTPHRINKVGGINFCIDFAATAFFVRGNGRPEGREQNRNYSVSVAVINRVFKQRGR